MRRTIYLILKSARPRQWIKNLALYAALFFSGFLFHSAPGEMSYFGTVTLAFIAFCFLTSAVYLFNDITDAPQDRQHPFKKKRPIASGELSVRTAVIAAIFFLMAAVVFSLWLGWFFKVLCLSYILLQLWYSRKLKHIPIVDISVIATGFLIRIYAGAVVVNLHTDVWFLLTVISTSLFLAVSKRQSERTLLEGQEKSLGSTRQILRRYSDRLLDQYIAMFATASWLTYAIFTFQTSVDEAFKKNGPELFLIFPRQIQMLVNSTINTFTDVYIILPRTLQSQKLLMLSLPFVIFGVMRYLQLIYEQNQGESPERVLLSDKPLLVTAVLFVSISFIVIYVLPII